MKRLFVLFFVATVAQHAVAQTSENTVTDPRASKEFKERRQKNLDDKIALMKELNLSDEQKAKLKSLNAGMKEKKEAIVNDSNLTEAQKEEQLNAIRKQHTENFKSVLTEEQKTKLKEIKARRRAMKTKRTDAAPASENQ